MSGEKYKAGARFVNGASTMCIMDCSVLGSPVVCFFHPDTHYSVVEKLAAALNAMEAGQPAANTQSDEIIAGIVAYINGRLADKHCEYSEKQWLYNIRSLCGNRQ